MSPLSLDTLRTVFTRSVDRLITQTLIEAPDTPLISELTALLIPLRLHCTFHPVALVELTQTVFQSVPLRDFILELTDELGLLLEDSDRCLEQFAARIEKTMERTHNTVCAVSLTPTHLHDQLVISNHDPLTVLLDSNRWLITIILLRLYFTDTAAFSTVVNTLATDVAR